MFFWEEEKVEGPFRDHHSFAVEQGMSRRERPSALPSVSFPVFNIALPYRIILPLSRITSLVHPSQIISFPPFPSNNPLLLPPSRSFPPPNQNLHLPHPFLPIRPLLSHLHDAAGVPFLHCLGAAGAEVDEFLRLLVLFGSELVDAGLEVDEVG